MKLQGSIRIVSPDGIAEEQFFYQEYKTKREFDKGISQLFDHSVNDGAIITIKFYN